MLRYWRGRNGQVPDLPADSLRRLRGDARTLRREVEQFAAAADLRLAELSLPAGGLAKPRMADVVWRPAVWQARCATLARPGGDGAIRLDSETSLYHDCPLREVTVRQIAANGLTQTAPFGLLTEVYGFSGSYLSISVRLPDSLVTGTGGRHILAVELTADCENPINMLARLNIAHGPDVAQLVQDLAQRGGSARRLAEFDLGHAGLNEKRMDKIWIDIFFQAPALNRIVVSDLILSRRPRAEL